LNITIVQKENTINMTQKKIIVFQSVDNLAAYAAELISAKISETPDGTFFSVALSGGSSPEKIFNYIASHQTGKVNWNKVRFFWGDERCVQPEDDESNYKMAHINLLSNLRIPEENIFRIHGEAIPNTEAVRYSKIIEKYVAPEDKWPRFDMVMLGLGEDGHTASIFPEKVELFHSSNICEAVAHPQSGQQRITLTGQVINNAKDVVFLVTGQSKEKIVATILQEHTTSGLPASFVNPTKGNLTWLLDADAAKLLIINPQLKLLIK